MSCKAIDWACSLGLKGWTRAVLVEIARHANRNNECRISRATLADNLGISLPTVKRCVRDLIKAEHITPTQRTTKRGGCAANSYTLRQDQQQALQDPPPGSVRPPPGVCVTPPRGLCDPSSTSYLNPSLEPESRTQGLKQAACARDSSYRQYEQQQPELVQLNGSAIELVQFIGRHCHVQPREAERMLTTNIRTLGAKPILDAFVQVQAEMATSVVGSPYKLFIAIARRFREQSTKKPFRPTRFG